ncbi:hypothetical protein A2U01_0087477 [Trifolium medium]|uniref:Uncharacterized protein n=1 Tax=Trifolium medium TaxID=97028 RepID=A0A392TYV9_9FABA|nr:hypothetical protein [Trifolium medium]
MYCAARSLCCAARNAVVVCPVFFCGLRRVQECLRRAQSCVVGVDFC